MSACDALLHLLCCLWPEAKAIMTQLTLPVEHSLSAAQIAALQRTVPGSMPDMIEGSKRGNAAGDQLERVQHAPAVMSPLTQQEQAACEAVHR